MTGHRFLSSGTRPQLARTRDDEIVQLRDIWMIVRRNLAVIAGSFMIAGILAAVYVIRATPVYRGETSIRIDDAQSTLPVLDVLKDLSTGNGDVISTEMEVLRSRTLAEVVADSLSLRMKLLSPGRTARNDIFKFVSVPRSAPVGTFSLTPSGNGSFVLRNDDGDKTIASVRVGTPFHIGSAVLSLGPGARSASLIRFELIRFAEVIRTMPDVLTIDRPSREANVVRVRYETSDPLLARDVPNVLAYSFIARRQVVKKSEASSTVRFLHQQLDTLTEQLARAEDSLKVFREQANIVSLDDEATAEVQQLAQLQAERSAIDAEHAALAQLLSEVADSARHAKPTDPSPYRRLLAFPTLLKNQSVSALFQALATEENERADLLVRRTAEDPDVMVLTDRIHDLENQVKSIATTYLAGLGSQVNSIDAQLSAYSKELKLVPAKEVEFARLQRRPKVLEDIYTMLQSRLKESEIAEAVQDPSVRVIDPAIVPDKSIKPNKPLVIALAAFLGLLAGCLIAFVRESMDRAVHTKEDVQRVTGAHVLALIPHIRTQAGYAPRLEAAGLFKRIGSVLETNGNGHAALKANSALIGGAVLGRSLVAGNDPRNPVSEAYRGLRTSLAFARTDRPPKLIVVTSPSPGDGKSTTAANLAITMARSGGRILLVDADMRRGQLHSVLGLRRDRGLSDVVLGVAEFAEAVHTVKIGEDVSFDFLSTGTLPPNPAELLGSVKMQEFVRAIGPIYGAILLDAPPVNVVTDAAVLGTIADGMLVVARAAVSTEADLAHAMSLIESVNAPVLGYVLNDVDYRRDARYQSGGYRNYEYYYSPIDEPTKIG